MEQNIFSKQRAMRHCFHCLMVWMVVWCISSCNDESRESYYVKMGVTQTDASTGEKKDSLIGEDYVWDNSKAGDIRSFFLYSNLPQWEIRVESDADWIEVWPGTGGKDGRFYVKVYPNESSEERTSALDVVSGGEVYGRIKVVQH